MSYNACYAFRCAIFTVSNFALILGAMKHNVMQLYLVADLEAQNLNYSQNLIKKYELE